jgi:hypothetical protein
MIVELLCMFLGHSSRVLVDQDMISGIDIERN